MRHSKAVKESQSEAMKKKMAAKKKIEEMSQRFADKEKFKNVWDLL